MYCPSCGVSNPPGATFCNSCGKELPSLSTSVTCPNCGADGQEYQFNCTKCGKELPRDRKITPSYAAKVETAPPVDSAAGEAPAQAVRAEVNACPFCGRPKSVYEEKCAQCSQRGPDYGDDSYSEEYSTSESELPKIAGALILVAGVLGIFQGLVLLGGHSGYAVDGAYTCCAGLSGVFGLIALAGGFSALGRGSLVFAILGGVFGILAVGFLLGALLSFIGLILVAISHKEFEG